MMIKKIKQKLNNAWNWTKDKARRFWKWGVAIVIGGAVLAAVIPPVDVSFENLPNVAKEAGIYRITFDKYSDVEIKNQDMPEVKLRKWGNETYIKITYPDFSPVNPKQDKGKMKWKNGNKEVHFYPIKIGEIDAFEFEIILKTKPATNKIVLNIESKGLSFYYQPELTQEEKDEGSFRPENIVGSYAVYHESKSGNYEAFPNGKNYMAGKAFHIYRPQMIDANGWKVWGELNISNGKMAIVIPQDFIDSAVYPIRHAAGLTFGYETLGTTNAAPIEDSITGSVFTMGATAGTADSIIIGLTEIGGWENGRTKAAIYLHSDSSLLTNGTTEENTVSPPTWSTVNWFTYNFVGTKPDLSASTDYLLLGWGEVLTGTVYLAYDAGDADQGHYDSNTYGTWPEPLVPFHNNNIYSIYATYTVAAPDVRRIIIIE